MRSPVGDGRRVLDRFLNATSWRHDVCPNAGRRCRTGARCLRNRLSFQLMELIEQDPFDLRDPRLLDVTGRRLKYPNFMATCNIPTSRPPGTKGR